MEMYKSELMGRAMEGIEGINEDGKIKLNYIKLT